MRKITLVPDFKDECEKMNGVKFMVEFGVRVEVEISKQPV